MNQSRAMVPPPAATRLVQRYCSRCGGKTHRSDVCPDCERRKQRPLQTRLQVSTPGDAGEREAERAALDVMAGRLPLVRAMPVGALVQRDGGDAGTTAPAPEPSPPTRRPAPTADSDSDEAATEEAAAAGTCDPKGLKRADYLKEPGTSVQDFGLTTLNVSATTFPSVATRKERGGYRIEPTTAALPAIPSVYTGVDHFLEGEAVFIDQDGSSGCPSGRKLPIHWYIVGSGADKIRAGEQEHCADFQLAFDLSLKRYAAAVNDLAASKRAFASQAAAEAAVTRKVGAPPSEWFNVFLCLTRKSLLRDSRKLHEPKAHTRGPRAGGPCEVRAIIDGRSLPSVGTVASVDLIKDCNEAGAPKTKAKAKPKASAGQAEVHKPDLTNAVWEPPGPEDEFADIAGEPALVQRSAMPEASAATGTHQSDPVDAALASSVESLDAGTRHLMEARFQRDFSQVRIHRDATATASAAALHAQAFTVGRDIVFGQGTYAPQTPQGRHLLAHELAHVVQQDALPRSVSRLVQRQPTSLAAIPADERLAIRIGTMPISVPAERITAFFTVMPSGRPSETRSVGATNSFDPAIPPALRTGLASVAAYVAGDTNGLPKNGTIEVELDLSAHGGTRTTYRFTYFEHTTGTGPTATTGDVMLIEQVGAAPAAPTVVTAPAAGPFTIGSTGFALAGTWSDADYTTLRQALGLLPAAALTAAAGLTFRRVHSAGTGAEGGHYDSGTDVAELNDNAFPAATDLRFGQRPPAVRSIVHEVGHAIDLRVLERAWKAYDSAGQTAAARRKLLAVRSPSGSRWARSAGSTDDEIQQEPADTKPAFRAAVRRDGVRLDRSGRTTPEGTTATLSGGVTTYSDTDYQELYAESFAMYVAVPDTLRRLRPATFAYFQGQFP